MSLQSLYGEDGDVEWERPRGGARGARDGIGGAGGQGGEQTEDEEAVVVPPVRLAPEAELARAALSAPLLAEALRLARWVAPYRPVDEWGDLTPDQEAAAAAELGAAGEEQLALLLRAWSLAIDLELVVIGKPAQGEDPGDGGGEVAHPGPALDVLDESDPASVLELWESAAAVVAETAVEAEADVEALVGPVGDAEDGEAPGSAEDEAERRAREAAAEAEYQRVEEATEEAEELLDEALQVLYESAALAEGEPEAMPLGVLAALLLVPEGEEPGEEMLGEITGLMVALDPMLQDLAEVGMVEYRPIDPTLFEEAEDAGADGSGGDGGGDASGAASGTGQVTAAEGEFDEAEAARFGIVRLTPLGLYEVRQWLLEDGFDAPLVGEHAGGSAEELLTGITETVNVLPEREIRIWAEGKEPRQAAGELLAAARGTDPLSPVRRMFCQVALTELGGGAEPAVRAVLDDPQLGGFARAWLADRGATDVPEPGRDVLLWTTIDTLAAQILDDSVELELVTELVMQLPVRQDPEAFFGELWRVEHPYTAEVLDAIGELHPDRAVGKEARRAAHKARSRS